MDDIEASCRAYQKQRNRECQAAWLERNREKKRDIDRRYYQAHKAEIIARVTANKRRKRAEKKGAEQDG